MTIRKPGAWEGMMNEDGEQDISSDDEQGGDEKKEGLKVRRRIDDREDGLRS